MRVSLLAILLTVCAGAVGAASAPAPGTPNAEKHFRFARIEIAAETYSDDLKPYFDEKPSFDKLEARLKAKKIAYVLSAVCKTPSDFPERVRPRLDGFKPGDNLLDRGEELAVIFKIVGIYPSKAECLGALDRLGSRPEPRA